MCFYFNLTKYYDSFKKENANSHYQVVSDYG